MLCLHRWKTAYNVREDKIYRDGYWIKTQFTWWQDCSTCGRTKVFTRKT